VAHRASDAADRDHTIHERLATRPPPIAPLIDVSTAARDLRHILTNTVGTSRSLRADIDIERIHLDDDDRVLLCTNGLTDAVAEDEIAGLLTSDDHPNEQCRTLADLAIASGGEDDVTALVARYRIPPP
jgi:PPM family protein phosphatase